MSWWNLKEQAARLKLQIKKLLSIGSASRTVVLAYMLLVLVPTALLLYGYYQHTARTTANEVIRAMQGTMLQTQTNVSYHMKNIERISNVLFVDPTLNDALKTDPETQTVFRQKQEQDAVLRILETVSDTEGVYEIKVYVNSPKLYRNERVNFFPFEDAMAADWFAGAQQAAGAIDWGGVRTVTDSSGMPERVVSCARMLIDLDHIDRIIGAVVIEVREQVFRDVLEDTGLTGIADIRLLDDEGHVVIGRQEQVPPAEQLTDGVAKMADEYLLVSSVQCGGWKLAATVSQNNLFKRDDWFGSYFGVAVLMLLFGLFMLAFFVIFGYVLLRVNRRIRRIAAKIQAEGAENYVRTASANDEFYDLERYIDEMIGNIQELMQRSYRAEIEKKDAQLKMLQAQINPHFLYNTLNSISWTAVRTGATEVNEMIRMLSQYFRLSLSGGRDMVRVQDEVSLASVYLDIQNVRFMGMIAVSMEIDDEILSEQMPKLTLQPILENAVLHGLQHKTDKDWRIALAGWRDGESIVFRISDNGVGMTPEQLDAVNKSLRREDEPAAVSGSFGLYNVYRRLELRYGGRNSLEIRSTRNVGTDVEVRIWCEKEEL